MAALLVSHVIIEICVIFQSKNCQPGLMISIIWQAAMERKKKGGKKEKANEIESLLMYLSRAVAVLQLACFACCFFLQSSAAAGATGSHLDSLPSKCSRRLLFAFFAQHQIKTAPKWCHYILNVKRAIFQSNVLLIVTIHAIEVNGMQFYSIKKHMTNREGADDWKTPCHPFSFYEFPVRLGFFFWQ